MGPLAGVDGCRGGWLVVQGESPATASVTLYRRWRELPLSELRVVAVDMPIGLAEAGRRSCDRLARSALPVGRKSSVFATPARPMLAMADYAAANAWGKATLGRGLSKQAWNITGKIAELDRALTPADQSKVFEAHPELAFNRLSGGRKLPPKRLAEGRLARRGLLEAAGFLQIAEWIERLPQGPAQVDDLLDAAGLLLTSTRIAEGSAQRLPSQPERDARGLDMAIWF